MKTLKTGDLKRFYELNRNDIDEENRTVSLSFSSENPVERWFGEEVLSHDPEHVRMDRLNGGAPLLWNHDVGDLVGRVETADIENGKGQAHVRFSKSTRGQELYEQVLEGIVTNVSVGYRIHDMQAEEGDVERFIATDWEPYEISLVSVPADYGVGLGRAAIGDHITNIRELTTMEETPQVDVRAVKDEARESAINEERQRVSTINSMAEDAPYLREAADKAVSEGMPVDAFQRIALDATKEELKRTPVKEQSITAPATVDMTPKETQRYSLLRAVAASASGDWSKAGFEKEVSDTLAQRYGDSSSGFYIPQDIPWGSQRDLTVGTDNAGGYLVGTQHMANGFIDALKANMVTVQLGAQVMPNLTGNISIPKLATGTSVYWVAEAAAPTEGQPVFAQLSLTPKNVAVYVQISRNLLVQSSPEVEAVVQRDITSSIAVALDAATLVGGGSNEPTGVLSTTGIGSVSFSSSGAPTWAEIVSVESQITADNAVTGSLAWVTHPTLAGTLKTTAKDAGSGLFISENNTVLGYPIAATTSMTAANILLGNFSEVIVAQFGAVEVITTRNATNGVLDLGLHMMVDVGVRYAESFAKGA